MKYKLYDNATNNIYEIDKVGTFLKNRGIENTNRYRNLNESDTYDYGLLDNMYDAVELFDKHYVNRDKIAILVDEAFALQLLCICILNVWMSIIQLIM